MEPAATAVPPIAVLAPGGAARRVRAALGALVVAAAAVCACSPGPGGPRGAGTGAPTGWDTDTGPLRSRVPDPRTLSVGVTHTRFSVDPGVPPAAAARAERVLAATASYQNQHVMGWGAVSPEPSPGRYDWSSLDHRLDLIRRSGGTPVVTLCCAPDWMKGGRAGRTDWDRLDVRPDRAHVADFAALSAAVARRYRWVRHYQVWNELKGFYDERRGRWDYEGYTELYNAVYDALKEVDPGLAVGGPYVVAESWSVPPPGAASAVSGPWGVVDRRALDVVTYWLAHKHGADFVAVDGGSMTRDRGLVTDQVVATEKFAAVTRWIRRRTPLPIWWSELYVATAPGGSDEQAAAVLLAALLRMLDAGVSVALLWQPEDDPSNRLVSLWRSTRHPGGGRPLPLAFGLRDLQDVLTAPAADGPPVRWLSPAVALARGRDATFVLNAADRAATVRIASTRLSVPPWRTRSLGPVDGAAFSAAMADGGVDEGEGPVGAPRRGRAAGVGARTRA